MWTTEDTQRQKRRRAQAQAEGKCTHCRRPNRSRYALCAKCRENNRRYYKVYRKEHSEKFKATQKENKLRAKTRVFDHYGKTCACCGEAQVEFLTIDHIEGGGNKHRKSIRKTGTAFYYWLISNAFPTGFQTLCYNCNCGRRIAGGVCPHERAQRSCPDPQS